MPIKRKRITSTKECAPIADNKLHFRCINAKGNPNNNDKIIKLIISIQLEKWSKTCGIIITQYTKMF